MDEPSPFSEAGYPMSSLPVTPRGRATYTSDAETATAPVRHLLGYERFTSLCAALGVKPRDIASSITRFGGFARNHRETIRTNGLEEPAAIVGNILVGYRHDAYWVRYGDLFPAPAPTISITRSSISSTC